MPQHGHVRVGHASSRPAPAPRAAATASWPRARPLHASPGHQSRPETSARVALLAGHRALGGSRAPRASPRSPRRVVGQVALERAALEQLGRASGGRSSANRSARAYWAAASRCAPSEPRARPRRARTQHRVGVAGGLGVVREPRGVRARRPAAATSAASASRCSATLRFGASDSSIARRASSWRNATPSVVGARACRRPGTPRGCRAALGGQRLEQPELGLRRDDRDRLEQRPRRRAQARGAGEHRVAHRRRDLTSPPPAPR